MPARPMQQNAGIDVRGNAFPTLPTGGGRYQSNTDVPRTHRNPIAPPGRPAPLTVQSVQWRRVWKLAEEYSTRFSEGRNCYAALIAMRMRCLDIWERLPPELVDLCLHIIFNDDLERGKSNKYVEKTKSQTPGGKAPPGSTRIVLHPVMVLEILRKGDREFAELIIKTIAGIRWEFLSGGTLVPRDMFIVYDAREWTTSHQFVQSTAALVPGHLTHTGHPEHHNNGQQKPLKPDEPMFMHLHPCGGISLVGKHSVDVPNTLISALTDICAQDLESLLSKFTRGEVAPPHASVKQLKASTAPRALEAWMESNMLLEVLKSTLADVPSLLTGSSSLVITDNIDFGLHDVSAAVSAGKSMDVDELSEWHLPRIHASSTSHHLRCWLLDASSVFSRQVLISNTGPKSASIVHISLQPNLGHNFFAFDDFGLVGYGTERSFRPDMKCVVLAPGQQYAVNVLFKVPVIGPQTSGHTGIFQSLLLCAAWTEDTASQDSYRKRSQAWKPSDDSIITVAACRVSAVVTHSETQMAKLLSVSALPFVPRLLQNEFCIFSSRPPHAMNTGMSSCPYSGLTITAQPPPSLLRHRSNSEQALTLDANVIAFLIPTDMYADKDSEPKAQEPDVYISVHDWQVWPRLDLSHLGVNNCSNTSLIAVISARCHASLGYNQVQVADVAYVHNLIESVQCDFNDHKEIENQTAESAREVLAYRRMIEVEGTAMLQETFTFDLLKTVPKLAAFRSPNSRRYTLVNCLETEDYFSDSTDSRTYKGPSIKLLQSRTTMIAKGPKGVLYLLALEHPGVLENRPHVVVGSRVHITYANSNVEEICWVLDQAQSYVLLSVPALFFEAAQALAGFIPSTPATVPFMVDTGLPSINARFALDRTPLQRMYMALLLNAASPNRGVFPPMEPPNDRNLPESQEETAYGTSGRGFLPQELFDSGPFEEDSTWHASSPSGALSATNVSEIEQYATTFTEIGAVKLNEEQRATVATVVKAGAGRKPIALFGPPGTGKTVTLVEAALQVYHLYPDDRLMLCAPQNFSADLLCSQLAAAGIPVGKMLRCNDPRLPPPRTKEDVVQYCLLDEQWGLYRWPSLDELKDVRVVVCTCIAAGFFFRYTDFKFQPPISFKHVFIDEAGQSPLPEAVLPLCLVDPQKGSCILAGDPEQLGPVIRSPIASAAGLSQSLLARLICYYRRLPDTVLSKRQLCVLVRNYRSHERLLQLPSAMFYNGQLIPCAPTEVVKAPVWSELGDAGGDCHTLMYGVLGQQVRDGDSPTFFNPQEAEVLARLVSTLIDENMDTSIMNPVTAQDVGVICTCRAQVVRVRNLLRSQELGAVRVGTVDDYQGQEERIVFISTVLTQPEQANSSLDPAGFFSNPKRFNVAITRAQALLVVVGHPGMLVKDPCWRQLVQFCVARGAVRGAGASILKQVSASRSSGSTKDSDTSEQATVAAGDEAEDAEEKVIMAAMQSVAQDAFLGLGHVDAMFPDTRNPNLSASSGEQQWRVML